MNDTLVEVMHTIHTGLYTPKAREVLYRIKLNMYNASYSNTMRRNASLSEIELAPDGEVIWKIIDSTSDPIYFYRYVYYSASTFSRKKTDRDIKHYIASYIKKIAYAQFIKNTDSNFTTNKDKIKELNMQFNAAWKSRSYDCEIIQLSKDNYDPWQTCEAKKHSLSYIPPSDNYYKQAGYENYYCYKNSFGAITFRELRCIYDKLLESKRFEKTWPTEMQDKIVGHMQDAIATELETARREELNKLNEQFKRKKRELNNWKEHTIDDMYKQIDNEFKRKLEQLACEHHDAIENLSKSFNFMTKQDPVAAKLFA